jgi:hypothetical protein
VYQRLDPGKEDELFARRPESQIGGIVGLGNVWYPNDDKVARTRYTDFFQPSDWPDLVTGKKVFYIVTKSRCQDKDGLLPETRSCRCVSLKDNKGRKELCWGHNT